jgi:ABC-2 type transport system permease protein
MKALRVLLHVIIKEFLQIRQDRRMIPVIFVAPVVQIIIFGFAVNTEVTHVPLVLVDLDRSAASRDLAERFVRSGYFDLAAVGDAADEADEWLVRGQAQVALVIGAGYGEALHGGRVPQVQLIADGSDASATTVALGYSASILNAQAAEVLAERLRAQVAAAAGVGVAPSAGRIDVVPRVFYNPDLLSRWFYVPAVLAMVLMLMTTMLSAMGVVREKEIGTMEQIIVTPIRTWQLIVGKLMPFAMIGFVQVLLVTSVTVWGFGVPLRGSFLLLLCLTQIFLLNTLGLGLLLSTLVRTQQQAMMTAGFGLMMPMLYLSGIIFPIENMPTLIQWVTYAIPLRYYAIIIRGIFLKGSGLRVLWPQAAALLVLGSAILSLAVARFRKRLD